MTADRVEGIIGILASMVLVGGALASRRVGFGRHRRTIVLAWIGIVLLLIVAGHWLDTVRPPSS